MLCLEGGCFGWVGGASFRRFSQGKTAGSFPRMFFVTSKIFGFFAIPSNLLIVLALLGAALVRTRFALAGWRLLVGGVVALAVCGLSPLGNALILPLEQSFPPWD